MPAGSTPNWLAGDRFWFKDGNGQFLLVDPVRKSRVPAFDQARVAAALSAAAGGRYDAQHLPFTYVTSRKDNRSIMVTVDGKEWSCLAHGLEVHRAPAGVDSARHPVNGRPRRPRGTRADAAALPSVAAPGRCRLTDIRSTWRPTARSASSSATGTSGWKTPRRTRRRQLTTDGVENFGYATDNAGWTKSDRADRAVVARLEIHRHPAAGSARRR